MKIVMTGGGSGGHITPLMAVAKEIKQQVADAECIYIGQRGDVFGEVVAENAIIDQTFTVQAGKFRRYHGKGWKQFVHPETLWLNVRDGFKVIAGIFQAIALIWRIKPDVLFCKGGFVGVPIGLAAAILRVPYVTHDSDAIPGLANRLIARWATCHAVALDIKSYPYPAEKSVSVGVPINNNYHSIDTQEKRAERVRLGLDHYRNIVLVTGGGLGAQRLNEAVIAYAKDILEDLPETCIIHATGQLHEAECSALYTKLLTKSQRSQVIVRGFVNNLHEYSAAADIVVARGGATSFAELALQAKPCIIVPNPYLTSGHQIKNAVAYERKHAIVCVQEADLDAEPKLLAKKIIALLSDTKKQASLSHAIASFARPDSTNKLASLLIDVASKKGRA